MQSYIAFLRAINVGGRFVRMATLASHFESLGCRQVATHVSSGNVLFAASARNTAALSSSLETRLETLLGFRADVFVRTPEDVARITARASSLFGRVERPGEVNVVFLAAPLVAKQARALAQLGSDADALVHEGTEVYWLSRTRQSESKVSGAVLERALEVRCTIRRLTTLRGLLAKVTA